MYEATMERQCGWSKDRWENKTEGCGPEHLNLEKLVL